MLLAKREGLFCVKTKVLVDATGDAAAVALAGYPRVKSQSVQPATLIHDLDGYDPQNLDPQLIRSYEEKWLREGRITMEDFQGNGILHSLKVKRIFMHLPAQEADSSAGRTQLETAARKNLLRIVQCVREIPGLEQLTVSHCAMECGVRETYRIVGEKTVTVQDYTQGVIFDDAVCYSFYPIDRHVPEGIQPVPLEPGVVPYHSLRRPDPKRCETSAGGRTVPVRRHRRQQRLPGAGLLYGQRPGGGNGGGAGG